MQNMNIANSSSQAVQLLSQLIETPRISREESQASQLLYDYMTEVCHLEVKRHGCNLWTIAPDFDANKPTLLLNAHIDTVKPVSGWQKDPWKATLEDDCLYGLGSNDDGASLVTLLHAFIELSSKHQPYNLVYLASAEEEVSGKNGIELVIPLLPRIDVAIVGEPTGMHPAIAEKGLMVLDVTAHGKAGHAARNEGDNAIYHAMDDMQWFRTYQWPLSSPLLGPVKMSVTILNYGTKHNVIPDTCTFNFEVRSNECYTNQELYNAICSQVKSEVKARSFRLGSSRIAPNHPLVTKAVQMGRVPFGSPTLSDQALMPWPSMKMGPGDSSRSHTADEFIRISEIEEAIQLYVEWLDGLRF
ncbi:MAG: M20 family metallo-hydrolase [Bacteroidaceae bacterium]|nr:M20 family metallo-hydrolase [Bacteroidaceae bacterium]